MSSPETLWLPPALTRVPEVASVANAAWTLPDLGAPLAAAEPVDASFEAGYAAGVQDGAAQAGQQLRPAVQMLQGVARELETRRADLLNDRQRDLEALALAVARRMVQREVQTDPTVLRDWIANALALLPHDLTVDVRLHPEELAAIAPLRDSLVPADSDVKLHWIADASVGRAGFVVESPQRLVDGRLDMALRALYERLGQE
jgi:flagellar assembly protein FliH